MRRRYRIVLGDYVGIGSNGPFPTDSEVGSKVLIASNVAFLNGRDHRIDLVGKAIRDSGRDGGHTIVVEDDVWIGAGAILLAPVRLGPGAVVGADSVGNPAKLIRMRFAPDQLLEHKRILRVGAVQEMDVSRA